jgi:hypothetical protein
MPSEYLPHVKLCCCQPLGYVTQCWHMPHEREKQKMVRLHADVSARAEKERLANVRTLPAEVNNALRQVWNMPNPDVKRGR